MSLYRLLDRVDQDGTPVETFASTEHTRGPWGAPQHGGPVAALLTRAMDWLPAAADSRIARVTVELLGPVPVDDVRVSARVVRPGRRIALLASSMEARDRDGAWRRVAEATAWRLATQETTDVVRRSDAPRPLPAAGPAALADFPLPDAWPRGGFVGALDWRLGQVGGDEGDPTVAWLDLQHDLVEGETTTDLERAVAVADLANGVGARLDPTRFAFLNTEVSVHLHQPPTGRWYAVEAETTVGPDGVGMSAAVLHSKTGPIGRVAQSLLVERR